MGKLISAVLGALVVVLVAAAPRTHAQGTNDFVFTNFEADYYLSNQDPQGSLRIVENMNVVFSGQNHGIERAIPKKYKGNSLKLSITSVTSDTDAPTQYTTRSENSNLVLRIGDPNRTITGPQQYTIEYTVQNAISFYDGYDELYWDINGDQWQQPFQHVTARVHLAEGLRSDGQLNCFTGSYGTNIDTCSISEEDGVITALITSPLTSSQTLTIVAGFEKGYFRPMTFIEKLRDNQRAILSIVIPPLLIGGYAMRHWLRNGRDPKGRGTIVVQYDPPKGLLPAQVGTVADFRSDQRDITATIIDLAIRGYIKIIEEKKVKRLRRDTLEYSVELMNADKSKLKDYEIELLEGIFTTYEAHTVVDFTALKNKFYKNVLAANKKITEGLVTEKYFKSNPATSGLRLWVLFFVAIFSMGFLGALVSPFVVVGTVLGIIPLFIFALAMPARTEKGVEAKEHALGLKMYLETAEADRIKMMQSPDAPYAQTAEPKKTVHLYEKLLPYAIVFGVEKQWSEEFKDIYTQAPEWFSGNNFTTFNSVYLASALSSSMNTAMATAYSAPSSSSGSGFSGGGGGGGGW